MHLARRELMPTFAAHILTDDYLRGESASIIEQPIRLIPYRRPGWPLYFVRRR